MTKGPWRLVLDRKVQDEVDGQDEVMRRQIERDIEKLETQGEQATCPLVKHFRGDVRYLRSKAKRQWFRIFYFPDGELTFRAFDALRKRSNRLARKDTKRIYARYKAATGKKLKEAR